MATVIISSELMEALEDKLKAQAETIARLTAELAQCEHDEGEMCECGHSIYDHTRKGGCFEPSEDDSGMTYCTCSKFEAAK